MRGAFSLAAKTAIISGPAEFRREMACNFEVGLRLSPQSRSPLDVEVRGYAGLHLRFAFMRFAAHRTAPTGRRGVGPLVVSLHQQGSSMIEQDGRIAEIGPGQMVMFDPARPFAIETTAMCTHALFIDRDALRDVLPEADLLTARPIETDRGAGAVLRAFVDELVNHRETLTEGQADDLALALPYLIAAPFQEVRTRVAGRSRDRQRARVTSYLLRHLGDAGLTVDRISRGTGMSARSLHELFAREPETVSRLLWRFRLERARRALAAPTLDHLPIGAIAASVGFRQLPHFTRAFRARYGETPRDFRRDRGEVLASETLRAVEDKG